SALRAAAGAPGSGRDLGASAPRGQSGRDPCSILSALGRWLSWVGMVGLLLSLLSCLGVPFILPWLATGNISEAQYDHAIGDIAAGLVLLAVAFGLLWFSTSRLRR